MLPFIFGFFYLPLDVDGISSDCKYGEVCIVYAGRFKWAHSLKILSELSRSGVINLLFSSGTCISNL